MRGYAVLDFQCSHFMCVSVFAFIVRLVSSSSLYCSVAESVYDMVVVKCLDATPQCHSMFCLSTQWESFHVTVRSMCSNHKQVDPFFLPK